MFDVEYYEKEDGTFPAEEFILSLDTKMQAKMFRELELLETFGNELREPHSKSLGDGIYEIRAKVASDITREALIKSRLTTWHTSCLQIFRHLARKLLEIRKYSCVAFVQADKKSDGAICAPDLISTSQECCISSLSIRK